MAGRDPNNGTPDADVERETSRIRDEMARLRGILFPDATNAPQPLAPAIRKALSEDLEQLEQRSRDLEASARPQTVDTVDTKGISPAQPDPAPTPSSSAIADVAAPTITSLGKAEFEALAATAQRLRDITIEAEHLIAHGNDSFALTCLSLIEPLADQLKQETHAAKRMLERRGRNKS